MNHSDSANARNQSEKSRKVMSFVTVALTAALVVTAVMTIAVSGAKANYIQTRPVQGVPVKITVDADLASGLAVLEHQATRTAAGDYALENNTEVSSNSYVLMPGVDILKDPFVRITGKTEIPAYLYIEVVDLPADRPSTYSYSIDSTNWSMLKTNENENVIGKNHGLVYVYNHGNSITKADTTEGSKDIYILSGNKVTVSPALDVTSDYSQASLHFYAYMAQAVDSHSAYDIFRTQLASD